MVLRFHQNDYISTDPRIQEEANIAEGRPDDIPEKVDVLIAGAGPAGMIAAAQLSQFPTVTTVIVDRSPGPLKEGRAEGIQKRSVETFQAFGFADQLVQESYRIMGMNFWRPDPENETRIIRAAKTIDDPTDISEFPHIISNQPRILDYFAQYMANSPSRMAPHYGTQFVGFEASDDKEYPLKITLRQNSNRSGVIQKTVYAKYLVGADGAHSAVRNAIGKELHGGQANRAWGVLAAMAETDFPDIRMKCAIQSKSSGSLLLIPREGGYMFRMYVDLGDVTPDNADRIRSTSVDESISRINEIMSPYSIDVKYVAWHSVYEVGHRVTDAFDSCINGEDDPRVFIAGDACHTHSAKAGQGMNVSLQDGFNLGWKLGHVASGNSPAAILRSYSEERLKIAQDLITFDREWYGLFAKRVDELDDPRILEEYYVKTAEFPAGFMTEYTESLLTGDKNHQNVAKGFPVGKRFRSAEVVRICDANPLQLGHLASADGRWRIYVFADAPDDGANIRLNSLADWLDSSTDSPLNKYASPVSDDDDALFDVHLIYPQAHDQLNIQDVPRVFKPHVGKYKISDLNKVYGTSASLDIYAEREVDPTGAIVIVRPDQYVGTVLPLDDFEGITSYFAPIFKSDQ